MKFGNAMRKETVTVNEDGTYTVKGGGWFWAKFSADQRNILETAPGMQAKKASRLFLQEARATLTKHFPLTERR